MYLNLLARTTLSHVSRRVFVYIPYCIMTISMNETT